MEQLDGQSMKNGLAIDNFDGVKRPMSDFHDHGHYEISLILQGEVKVLLRDRADDACACKVVLVGPRTPHMMIHAAHMRYRRTNLMLSEGFVAACAKDWQSVQGLFEGGGRVVSLSEPQAQHLCDGLRLLEQETDSFRQRLLVLYLLSKIGEFGICDTNGAKKTPAYMLAALSYIEKNYKKKLLASELAERHGIGRTTFLTDFKKHTGNTFYGYVTGLRLQKALALLKEGKTELAAAQECGFGDTCTLIRSFKKRYGTTPYNYIKQSKGEKDDV